MDICFLGVKRGMGNADIGREASIESDNVEPQTLENAELQESDNSAQLQLDSYTQFSEPTPIAVTDSVEAGYMDRTIQAIRQGTSIAGILRIGGAGLMVFSLSLFLMQGMEATSDLQRYLLLLGQTALLTAAGFAVGFVLKEPRGARVFFSLALVSIPANFAVLGAMIYSLAPLETISTVYPSYARWQTTNIKDLVIAGIVGLLVLLPMSVFCFAVLARKSKWWLSAAYLLASAALLIPLRETMSVAAISCVCLIAIIALLAHRRKKDGSLSTGEEKFAKALLFIPAGLMLARSAMLYSVDFHFALMIVIGIYYLLRRLVVTQTDKSLLSTFVQTLTVFSSFILSAIVGVLIAETYYFMSPFIAFVLLWLVLNLELVTHISSALARKIIHGIWAMVCCAVIAINIVLFSYGIGFMTEFTLAMVLITTSVFNGHKLGTVLGTLALVGVFVMNGTYLAITVMTAGWVGLAITGAATIVAGSLLEKYWPVVKLQLSTRFAKQRGDSSHIDEQEAGLINVPLRKVA